MSVHSIDDAQFDRNRGNDQNRIRWAFVPDDVDYSAGRRLANQGLCEQVEAQLARLGSELVERRWRNFRRHFDAVIDDLGPGGSNQRIGHLLIRQAGLRQNTMKSPCLKPGAVLPLWRRDHVRMTAARAIIPALKLDFDPIKTLATIIAGSLHDVGHSAYCHPGDVALQAIGRSNHEVRGISLLCYDHELRNYLDDIDRKLFGYVIDAIFERGDFAFQSLADSFYIDLDGWFLGTPPPEDLYCRVVGSLEASRGGLLYVNDIEPIVELLNWRARLRRDFYWDFHGRVQDSAVTAAISYGFAHGWFTPEQLETGDDAQFDAFFEELINDPHQLPNWVVSILHLARGDLSQLQHWIEDNFPHRFQFQRRLAELEAQGWPHLAVPYKSPDNKRVLVVKDDKRLRLGASHFRNFEAYEDDFDRIYLFR